MFKIKNKLKTFLNQENWFSHFKEADIKFPPTYKFNTKTNEFSSSRIPSYCDRILYNENFEISSDCESNKNGNQVKILPVKYDCISELNNSDHKPVCGLFEIKVFIGTSHVYFVVFVTPLCFIFKKANIMASKWRVKFERVYSNDKNNLEIVYQVSDCYQTHKKDWIGLYEVSI